MSAGQLVEIPRSRTPARTNRGSAPAEAVATAVIVVTAGDRGDRPTAQSAAKAL